ncbi:HNH endonuclease [Bacillus swezeyi]|uniref:HNH endonuclease n=2 Tax=Bacillus swezeyi TaxID=1925020 RepID=A0A5M8RHY6_9BACI|nr:HNH endonuclease [Bacillus swezeyi]KAA6471578.1 HNH endonuclease [Bacillus swezeyi]
MNGTYGRVLEHTKEFKGAQIKAGSKSTKTYNVKSTKFWIARNVTTAAWTGYVPLTDTSEAGPQLANKIADFYPTIYNEHSKKYMPIPTKANMKTVPEDKRTPWDSSKDRYAYIKKYINTYGNPKWDWHDFDIHHVIPREYGGNNAFNNLYPLPRELHQQVVNSWWFRY